MPRDNLNTTLPSSQTAAGFGAGLIPLHSQLLGESWLVSFPPLSDMLKFSGYSRLIRGQGQINELAAKARRISHIATVQNIDTQRET